jgi:hypothetical protein
MMWQVGLKATTRKQRRRPSFIRAFSMSQNLVTSRAFC